MNDYLLSFLLYSIPANMLAFAIILLGRKKIQWHALEYFFIYLPWLGFVGLTLVIFGGLDQVPDMPAIRVFLIVFQSLGSGVMGGAILLPRIAMKNQKMHPVAITSISAVLVTVLYVKFRMMLFILVEGVSSMAA